MRRYLLIALLIAASSQAHAGNAFSVKFKPLTPICLHRPVVHLSDSVALEIKGIRRLRVVVRFGSKH